MAADANMNHTVHPVSAIPWTAANDDFDELWEGSHTGNIPDMLETMFANQLRLMGAYDEIGGHGGLATELRGVLDARPTQRAIREFASYTVEELYEAINHLKNKPWKQTDKPTDVNAFHEELADMWHFLIELHILAGISPLDVFKEYFRKTLVNTNRIQSGY